MSELPLVSHQLTVNSIPKPSFRWRFMQKFDFHNVLFSGFQSQFVHILSNTITYDVINQITHNISYTNLFSFYSEIYKEYILSDAFNMIKRFLMVAPVQAYAFENAGPLTGVAQIPEMQFRIFCTAVVSTNSMVNPSNRPAHTIQTSRLVTSVCEYEMSSPKIQSRGHRIVLMTVITQYNTLRKCCSQSYVLNSKITSIRLL